ncbi:uncharacterized protein N7496_011859 [Penicillium cataractarum]|uniref:Uncharacterized protein n=1 Tax=Penicillium cataractarum TaxID=2100454 RepID=A0A9W9RFY5_9EURO|nr:uncharacterized protein N7496_011859 [Penicillium cataractarum]KAJ5359446.1 hypothetical protein N7496_011859 [Penicillium cataractarum]
MANQYTHRLNQLVSLVEEEGWSDFGFLLFRTSYNDENLWSTFLEYKDQILSSAIQNAPPESGLSHITDKMYLKQVSNEALRDITPEQVAIAYRSLEDGAVDGDGNSEDRIEPGLRTSVCLMVDEECMRSVVGWVEGGLGTVPFVKAVDVLLGEEEVGYSGVFRVAISSLFTEFYLEQLECGETVELAPEGDGVWRGLSKN